MLGKEQNSTHFVLMDPMDFMGLFTFTPRKIFKKRLNFKIKNGTRNSFEKEEK